MPAYWLRHLSVMVDKICSIKDLFTLHLWKKQPQVSSYDFSFCKLVYVSYLLIVILFIFIHFNGVEPKQFSWENTARTSDSYFKVDFMFLEAVSSHRGHWVAERVMSAGLYAVIPAAFILEPSFAMDTALCTSLVIHSHWWVAVSICSPLFVVLAFKAGLTNYIHIACSIKYQKSVGYEQIQFLGCVPMQFGFIIKFAHIHHASNFWF